MSHIWSPFGQEWVGENILANLKMGSKGNLQQHWSFWTDHNTDPLDVQASKWLQEPVCVPAGASSLCPYLQWQNACTVATGGEEPKCITPDPFPLPVTCCHGAKTVPCSSSSMSHPPSQLHDCICSWMLPNWQKHCLGWIGTWEKFFEFLNAFWPFKCTETSLHNIKPSSKPELHKGPRLGLPMFELLLP